MGLRTTAVGSWWPYPEEDDALRRFHAGELSQDEADDVLNRCATQAIFEQRELGLDEWTGGEYFADRFVAHFAKRLTGIRIDSPPAEDEFDYDDFGHVEIVGDITAPDGLGHAAAFRREATLPGGVGKATVVSPFELLLNAADQREAIISQMPNLISIVNTELKELVAAGCPHVQLDAPVLGILVNQEQMPAEQAAQIVAACFDGVAGATRGLHICNGNNRGRPFSSVLRNATWVPILQRLDGVVDIANLESSYFSEYLERETFRELPPSMQLAAGIVDEASYWVETVNKIRSRAADWARVVGEERLWIALSCGLGRHAARDRPVLEAKVRNLVAAAASL